MGRLTATSRTSRAGSSSPKRVIMSFISSSMPRSRPPTRPNLHAFACIFRIKATTWHLLNKASVLITCARLIRG